jgi:hypothetical protein
MLPTPMPMPPFYRRRGDNPHVPLPFVPPSRIPEVTLAQHIADKGDPHETLKLLNENLATFVTGGRFVPETCRIELLHGTEVLDSIDASPFVKDGMVQSVAVSDGNLVITWNSDSGASAPTAIPLTDIFNPDNFYDKTSADGKFVAKETGKRLITDAEGTKLSGVESGAKDNVVEAAGVSAFPQTGAVGKIYVAKDENKTYRWDGSQYVQVGGGGGDVNVIETVKVNGTALVPVNKAVDITAYQKPQGGIPSSDMAQPVRTSLGKANTAVQPADVTLAALTAFSPDWVLDVPDGYTVVSGPLFIPVLDPDAPPDAGEWRITVAGGIYGGGSDVAGNQYDNPNATEVIFTLIGGGAITATCTVLRGYRLGPDNRYNPNRDMPLASEAEAEALRAGKLDSSSAAAPFSESSTYAVGTYVTYNGGLYVCSAAVTTAGAWTGSTNWTAKDMTTPDATLDVTPSGSLKVVAANGDTLWEQGYDLVTESSDTLGCDKVNYYAFAATAATAFSDATAYAVDDRVAYDGKVYKFTSAHSAGAWIGTDAAEDPDSHAFAMPTAATGQVGDFGLDVDNSANTVETMVTLTGLDNAFSVVVPKGESLVDMLTFAGGELAVLYFTLTAFRVNNLPTWQVLKQVVENGGAVSP